MKRRTRHNTILVLVSAVVGIVLLLTANIFAATSVNGSLALGVDGLEVTWTGSQGKKGGLGNGEDGTASVEVQTAPSFKANVKSSKRTPLLGGVSYPEGSSVSITLKNVCGKNAKLHFEYSCADASNGTVSVSKNGTALTGTAIDEELSNGEFIVISISTGKDVKGYNGVNLYVNELQFIPQNTRTVSFLPGEHGSYKVDGVLVDSVKEYTRASTEAYTVNLTPDSGYTFVGWRNTGTGLYISYSEDLLYIAEDCTIKPFFAPNDLAQFEVEGQVFIDLNKADEYAVQQGSNKILLRRTGSVPAADTAYIISSGITLLIPYSESTDINTTEPLTVTASAGTQKPYKQMKVAKGATIEVLGSINVNGRVLENKSIPTGPYGLITLEEGSRIVLKSGANLYCWGYINGNGLVDAEKGSNVYECFQLNGWRGGQATVDMIGQSKRKVFPVNQYYIQNVEATLKLNYGATEYVYASVTVNKSQKKATEKFISSESGMFQLKEEGSSFIKRYIPETDRMELQIDGTFEINTITMNFGGSYTLASQKFPLPINSNFTVIINSGTTTAIADQDLAMLPGAELIVAKGAILNINSVMYVYDQDDWGDGYAYTARLLPVTYATTTHKKRTEADLIDAKIDVNGIINISEDGSKGRLFTTSGGSNIISSQGNGVIKFKTATDNSTSTYQATQTSNSLGIVSVTYHEIFCTTAKLLNGDGSYTVTTDAKGPENGKPGWSYTYLTTDPEYAEYTDTNVYKNMWYRYRVIYKINGQPKVKYITTDSDTFVLDQNIPLTGDKIPVVTTNNATATLDTKNRQIVLSGIYGDCIVEFTSETVYKINVSWTGNLNFEYKPNIYRWDATTMRYIREQEAGWRSDNPTVTVTNDKESGSTGTIQAKIDYNKGQDYRVLDMLFTIGDNTTPVPNSAVMAAALAPGNSVTAKMQMDDKKIPSSPINRAVVGKVTLTLTTAD